MQARRRGVLIQLVHRVGIVPHNDEFTRRELGQPGNAFHGVAAVDAAGGVGESGYAPEALDARVGRNQVFYLVHVRAGVQQAYWHHLDAQILADGEMTVIAWHRAEKPDLFVIGPGAVCAAQAFAQGEFHHLVHQGQAAAATNQRLFGCGANNAAEQGSRLR
jgi:hypothetical protein